MPPYQKNKSKSQQRRMFALARDGEISMADAIGRARASKGSDLPEHVKKSEYSFGLSLMKIADEPGFFGRVKDYAATHHFPGAEDVKRYGATHHFPGLQNVTPGVGEATDLARGAARNVARGARSAYDRFTSGVGNAVGNAGWGLVGGGHAVESGLEQAGQRGADWAGVYGQRAQGAIRGGLERTGKAIGNIIPPAPPAPSQQPPQNPAEKVGFILMKLSVDAAGAAETASPWYDAVKDFRLTRSAVAGAGSGVKSFVVNRFMPEPVVALNHIRKAKDKIVRPFAWKQDETAAFNQGKDLTERGLDATWNTGKKMWRGATEGAVDYGKTMAEGLGTAANTVRSAVPNAPDFGAKSIYQRGAKWLTNAGSDIKNISTGIAKGEAGTAAEGATSLASRLPSYLPTVAKHLPSLAEGGAVASKVFGKAIAPLAVVDAASGSYNLGKKLDLAGLNAKYNPVWGGVNRGVAAGTEQMLKSDTGRNVVNAVEGGLEGADKLLSHPYRTIGDRFKGFGSALAHPVESAQDFGRGAFGSNQAKVDTSNIGPGHPERRTENKTMEKNPVKTASLGMMLMKLAAPSGWYNAGAAIRNFYSGPEAMETYRRGGQSVVDMTDATRHGLGTAAGKYGDYWKWQLGIPGRTLGAGGEMLSGLTGGAAPPETHGSTGGGPTFTPNAPAAAAPAQAAPVAPAPAAQAAPVAKPATSAAPAALAQPAAAAKPGEVQPEHGYNWKAEWTKPWSAAGQTRAIDEKTNVNVDTAGNEGYTVQPKDTIGSIARRTGQAPGALLAQNPWLSDPNKIQPGQNLLTRMAAGSKSFGDVDFAGGEKRFQAAKSDWNTHHPAKAAPSVAGTPADAGVQSAPWLQTQGGKQVFTPTEAPAGGSPAPTSTPAPAPAAPPQKPDWVNKQEDYANTHGGTSLNGSPLKSTRDVSGNTWDYKYQPGFNKKSEAADIIRKIAAASNFASSVKDPMTSGGADSGKALPTADMSNTGNAYGSQAQRGTFGNAMPAETTIPGMPTDKAPKDTSKIDVGQFKANQATTTR